MRKLISVGAKSSGTIFTIYDCVLESNGKQYKAHLTEDELKKIKLTEQLLAFVPKEHQAEVESVMDELQSIAYSQGSNDSRSEG